MKNKITFYTKIAFYLIICFPLLNSCGGDPPGPNPSNSFVVESVVYDKLQVNADELKTTQDNISLRPEIKLNFSFNLDASSLKDNISLIDKLSKEKIEIQFKTIANAKKGIIIQLNKNGGDLDRGSQYELTITENVKSTNGANLKEKVVLSFNTIRKSEDASLKISYNRRNIVSVNNIFTLRTSTIEEAQAVRLTFTVADNANLVEGDGDTVVIENNILIKTFQFTDGETKKFTIISEDGSNAIEYQVRARVGAKLTENDILNIRIKVDGKEYNGEIDDNNIVFKIKDFSFGADVLKPTISFIDISSYATSNKLINSVLNFEREGNEDTIIITAENTDLMKNYKLSVVLTPRFPSFKSYTDDDTLGGTIQHSLVNNLDIIRISDLSNNIAFSYTINGVKSSSTKTSNGGIITFQKADFPFNLSSLNPGDTIPISIEANQQKSFTKVFVYRPEYIYTWQDFQAMSNDKTLDYIIKRDIIFDSSYNFTPIGTRNDGFSGSLNGNGFEVRNLYINNPNNDNIGIFASTTVTASITDVKIKNATLIAQKTSGMITGINKGVIENCSVFESSITGSGNEIGGLVGQQSGAKLSGAFQGTIRSSNGENIGGLAGINYTTVVGFVNGDSIIGLNNIGGLVGTNYGTIIGYSTTYITGNVVGGLAGRNISLNGNSPSIIGFGILQVSPSTTLSGGLIGQNTGSLTGYWSKSKGATSFKASGTSNGDVEVISAISNIVYVSNSSPPSFYDNQGTLTTADDNTLAQFDAFNQYFDIELFKNPRWSPLKRSLTVGSDLYNFTIQQPLLQ